MNARLKYILGGVSIGAFSAGYWIGGVSLHLFGVAAYGAASSPSLAWGTTSSWPLTSWSSLGIALGLVLGGAAGGVVGWIRSRALRRDLEVPATSQPGEVPALT